MTVGRQQAEQARMRVLGGPDSGVVFVVTSNRVTIGRGEENDVILTDLKASRKHAELVLGTAGFIVRDLGSAHGILVNGKPQKQVPLKSGDKIGLGETVLEFISAEAGATRLMVVPPPQATSVVGTGTSGLTQFIQRPGAQPQGAPKPASSVLGVGGAAPATAGKGSSNFIEKNKKLIMILGVLMALAVMIPEVEKKQNAKRKKYVDPTMDTMQTVGLGPAPVDAATIKAADNHFKECFKEHRASNYLRAKGACDVALQVYPDHALARIYLNRIEKDMEWESIDHLTKARRDLEAARYKSALERLDAIKRLYAQNQSHRFYKEADRLSIGVEKCMKEITEFDKCLNDLRKDLGKDIDAMRKELKDQEKADRAKERRR